VRLRKRTIGARRRIEGKTTTPSLSIKSEFARTTLEIWRDWAFLPDRGNNEPCRFVDAALFNLGNGPVDLVARGLAYGRRKFLTSVHFVDAPFMQLGDKVIIGIWGRR